MSVITPTRQLERRFWTEGFARVVGVDEVGRGPLAGPLTVAAVVLPARCRLPEVRDSKLLAAAQRAVLARQIRRSALAVGLGWASRDEIDLLGLTVAARLAGVRALGQLGDTGEPAMVILDGRHNYLGDSYSVHTCVKADQSCLAVAAASIVAKVARDHYMELADCCYPQFGFALHKGYATAEHVRRLREHGPSPLHRRSFAPVGELAGVGG